jgi:hypothetical protein
VRVEEPAPADASAPAEALADTPAPAAFDVPDTLDTLRQRVAMLEAENAALRAQLAALQGG